jgi:hypothetical protein
MATYSDAFTNLEEDLNGVRLAHEVPSARVPDDPELTEEEQQQHNASPAPFAASWTAGLGTSQGPKRPTKPSRRGFPSLSKIVIPPSLFRIAIAFFAMYTITSLAEKYGFVAKPYIPLVAAIAVGITLDQLRWFEIAKRTHFIVFFWVAMLSALIARGLPVYSALATIVLYTCARVNSRAPRFLLADCAIGAIATWFFI